MSEIREEHEKELLKRLVLSYWDFDQAKQFAQQILIRDWQNDSDEVWSIIHRALNTALLVAYARPFTHNDKGKQGKVCSLPEKIIKVFDSDEKKLHQKIVGRSGLRNSVYAHSDSEPHDLKISIHNIGGIPLAIPLKGDPFTPLPKTQVANLDQMIDKLTAWILKEKIRIQAILPVGTKL
jgi:hypothetical protein